MSAEPDRIQEFINKLDQLQTTYGLELSSSMDIDVTDTNGYGLMGYYSSVVKASEFRDLGN